MAEHCPNCGREAGEASFSTAPNQLVCSNEDCPVNTWDPTRQLSKEERLFQALTQEDVDRLKAGDKLEFLVSVMEPLSEDKDPSSMDVLEVSWYTKGVAGNRSLEDEYSHVIGLGDE